jgi:hypothetical protein
VVGSSSLYRGLLGRFSESLVTVDGCRVRQCSRYTSFGVYPGHCVDGTTRPVSDRTMHVVAGVGRTVSFVESVSTGRPRRSDTTCSLLVRLGMGN